MPVVVYAAGKPGGNCGCELNSLERRRDKFTIGAAAEAAAPLVAMEISQANHVILSIRNCRAMLRQRADWRRSFGDGGASRFRKGADCFASRRVVHV